MARLYTVKEIAEILTNEFGDNPANYKFTEERVRARLRSARTRGTIIPKRMGYDRRTKYYSEEDVEKLKSFWTGPELPEFTEYEEDIEILDPDTEEVEVRPGSTKDIDSILRLFGIPITAEDNAIRIYLEKTLRPKQNGSFVALFNDDEIVGWTNADISAAQSLLDGQVTGIIRVYVPLERKEARISARSLVYRAELWLTSLGVKKLNLVLPKSIASLEDLFAEKMHYKINEEARFLYKQDD